MRQQLLLWVPFRRYRQRWGLYLATPARVAAEGRMLGLHRCESCGQAECDAFYGVTSFDSRRVLVDVTEPEAKIADTAMHELLHVARGPNADEAPHDEAFVRGAEKGALHIFAQFGLRLPPFPERYAEFRAEALRAAKETKR